MSSTADQKAAALQALLKVFDSLPDVRALAVAEAQDDEEDVSQRIAKLTAEHLNKKSAFVRSEVLRHDSTCMICKQEFQNLDYDFYKDGVKVNATVDLLTIHRVREHGEDFPADVRDFLSELHLPGFKSRVASIHTLNRDEVCPFLIRIFIKKGLLLRTEDFSGKQSESRGTEVFLHGWVDTTLRELVDLLKEIEPSMRERGTRVQFASVYQDKWAHSQVRELGSVDSSRDGRDDVRTLHDLRYQVGDALAVSVFPRRPM